MKWETETPQQPKLRYRLKGGSDLWLTVSQEADGSTFRHMTLSFGKICAESADQVVQTWPREALALARAALDKFEAELEKQRETTVEGREVVGGTAQA
jgi:hypothetical protein